MSNIEHNHMVFYKTRFVELNIKGSPSEYIEFICLNDGIIFRRIEIKEEQTDR